MADPTARELKLIQYLNEAYGKEKQLEVTLQAQIKLANAEKTLKKRLQDHYKETKAQSRNIERRIKALGGKADAGPDLPGPDAVSGAVGGVTNVANKALAAAKGPVQALRGTGPEDNLLRNVRDAYWNEAEEIAHYNVIEAAANALDDKETAKLAKEHRRQEERMQKFLEGQIDKLVKSVVRAEIPAKERRAPGAAASTRSTSRSTGTRSSGGSSRSTARKSSASSSSGSGSSSRKSSGSSARKSSGSSTTKRSSPARKSSGTTRAASSGSSTRKSSGSSARKSSGTTRAKSSGTSSSSGKS
jgi:ferritin-like metal-binding protein YciE